MAFSERTHAGQSGPHCTQRGGLLLCHGFTGSPQSMRPWGEHHAEHGFTVQIPTLPGHGTCWQDMATSRWQDWYGAVRAAALEMHAEQGPIAVGGLSMGGALTLKLAADPDLRGKIAAIVLVNPALTLTPVAYLAEVLALVRPTIPGVGSDIRKEGVREEAYERTPVRSVAQLRRLLATVRGSLPQVEVPMLLATSPDDKIVNPRDSERIAAGVRSPVERLPLLRSGHVATLDYDAPDLFEASLRFLTAVMGPTGPGQETR